MSLAVLVVVAFAATLAADAGRLTTGKLGEASALPSRIKPGMQAVLCNLVGFYRHNFIHEPPAGSDLCCIWKKSDV